MKTEAGLTEKQKEMKACMLPDDNGVMDGLSFSVLGVIELGLIGFHIFQNIWYTQ